jgi:hypothetical protein
MEKQEIKFIRLEFLQKHLIVWTNKSTIEIGSNDEDEDIMVKYFYIYKNGVLTLSKLNQLDPIWY